MIIEAFQIEQRILNKQPKHIAKISFARQIGAGVDSLLGTNTSGTNTGPDAVSLGRIKASDLGFDQSVLDTANTRRGNMMEQMLARRGGMASREAQGFQNARDQQLQALEGMQRGMGLADRIGTMAGRDSGFYRGLEGQSQGLQQQTAGLQDQARGLTQDMGQYRNQLDSLSQEMKNEPTAIRNALVAQRKEGIQRDAQGQKLAMERTLASRGVDPTSLKALTAIGGVDANVMQQNRLAQQGAGLDAQQMQQSRLNQRANLLQSGMSAVGQQANMLGQQGNFINARQNLLNNLRQGRAQEFGMDQSALGAGMQGQFAGSGQYANMANANNQFGLANTQMGVGLDQAGVQDAVFDINRMDQKRLSAQQINAGMAGQEAQANAQAQGAHAQAQAQKQSGFMGAIATAGTVKMMMMCIPEGTLIDIDQDFRMDIRDIQVGQKVIGYNGEQVKVLQKHEYLEDPYAERFYHIEFDDGAVIELCDMHKVEGIRAKDLEVGDQLTDRKVTEITTFDNVEVSYDILTEDSGYQIEGVPINSMIEELAEVTADLRKVA